MRIGSRKVSMYESITGPVAPAELSPKFDFRYSTIINGRFKDGQVFHEQAYTKRSIAPL